MRFADPDRVLARAAGPDGRRRFHDPEGNPATHRLRAQLFTLVQLQAEASCGGTRSTREIDDQIEYLRAEIRRVDISCDIDKARFLLAHYQGLV